jgi:hypothetical protein
MKALMKILVKYRDVTDISTLVNPEAATNPEKEKEIS